MNIVRGFFTFLGNRVRGLRTWAAAHKATATVLALVVVGGGTWAYGKVGASEDAAAYMLGYAQRSSIVQSVSASGQVSASNKLDITADASGDLVSVSVKAGQKVGKGAVIARLDASDALKTLRDARTSLETAELSLEKLKKPASALSLTQAENALAQAKENKQTAEDSLAKAYAESYDDVVNVFLDMPDLMASLEDVLTGTSVTRSQWNMDYYVGVVQPYDDRARMYKDDAYAAFKKAKSSYDAAYTAYKSSDHTSSTAQIETVLNSTDAMLAETAKAIRSMNSFLQLYKTTVEAQQQVVPSEAQAAINDLATFTTDVNADITTIVGDVAAVKNAKTSIASAARTITEREQSLIDAQDGSDALDIRSAELTVQQRRDAVADAERALADYTVRSPFAGTVATVDATAGQRISGGGAIATIVTDQKIASLTLNEVDATKVKLGDKATLTYDALEELTLTGSVVEIDTLGTVTQGVVSYAVEIAFDSQDERIKAGMTVNAAIITESKTDVLSVPSSAVKTQNGSSYVLAFDPAIEENDDGSAVQTDIEPSRIPVATGITDDTTIEIVSGLTEGQQIVVRTMTASAAASATAPQGGATRGNTTTTRGPGGPAGGATMIRF